jgi:hypothetical protein
MPRGISSCAIKLLLTLEHFALEQNLSPDKLHLLHFFFQCDCCHFSCIAFSFAMEYILLLCFVALEFTCKKQPHSSKDISRVC